MFSLLPKRVALHFSVTFLLLFSAAWLSGCSAVSNKTVDTLWHAFSGPPDVVLSTEQIRALPYASAYLRVGDGPKVFVVLAYADGDRLSWLSADGVMIVTQHGRVIKTVGLANDLRLLDNLAHDPLAARSPQSLISATWTTYAEWRERYTSGYQLVADYKQIGKKTLTIMDQTFSCTLIEEKVTVTTPAYSWRNRYWLDATTGQVRQLVQQLGPDLPMISMTFLKPYTT